MKLEENAQKNIIQEELEIFRLNQRLANDFFIESIIQNDLSYNQKVNAFLYKGCNLN